jgi:hypothetical protein
MTRDSSLELIEHWMERIYHEQELFKFNDLSPKALIRRINRSRKSSKSMKPINLDSLDEETGKHTKSSKATTTTLTNTPPTSDVPSDNNQTPQEVKVEEG